LGRVIDAEYPHLGCTRVDLDPGSAADQLDLLINELRMLERKPEIAFRGPSRYVSHLVAHAEQGSRQTELKIPVSPSFRLECSRPGSLDQLSLTPLPRAQLGREEIEIEVRAAALNFRDVMSAMGLYPGGPIPLGSECAGRITATGSGVEAAKAGDDVIAVASGCFGRFAIANAQAVVPKPTEFTFEEAATIPISFLTAYYALHHLARLSKGERVLIHAGNGGVGRAARTV